MFGDVTGGVGLWHSTDRRLYEAGMTTIAPGVHYRLPDGRKVLAHRDDDLGGIALLTTDPIQKFVLRAAWSGGRPWWAVVERCWPPGAPLTAPVYRPTDFILADLTPWDAAPAAP
jgi:hypothetical protein